MNVVAAPRAAYACPKCRVELAGLVCEECGSVYASDEGVPVLVAGETMHAASQATFFDAEADAEFEIERPLGTPALYDWLLREKFRLGTRGVELAGRSVLVVCGGSGMDAEFLVEAGARVVTSDISVGAARRALERARRHGFPLASLVANAARLPFADGSVDVVYVHDGLHHLERPLEGLIEMTRVAREAIFLTEPANAAATALAARIGLAQTVEEAGNRVERLRIADVRDTLEARGFRVVRARRYAMLYRHEAGPVMRALSRPPVFPLARTLYRVASVPFAPIGNKLTVTAVRG